MSTIQYEPATGALPGLSFVAQTVQFLGEIKADAAGAGAEAAEALTVAAEAAGSAQQAALSAQLAAQAAAQAQSFASAAQTVATAATQTADSAYTLADTAEANAQTAIGEASTASVSASSAQARADAAYSLASQAQATATSASVDAAKAQNSANVADVHALAAATTASGAATDAAAALAGLAAKQDRLTAGANIAISGNVISATLDFPSVDSRSVLYLNGTALQETAPTGTSTTAFALSGTTATLRSFAYTVPTAIQISQRSYYDAWLYLSGLQNTNYTVTTSWRYGSTVIATGRMVLPVQDQNVLFFQVPMYVNLLSAPLDVLAGAALNLDVSIAKSGGGSHTVTLTASAQYPASIVRNGGEISANSVYGLWGGQILSQAAINAIVAQYIATHP